MEISKARKDSLAAACVTGGALVLAYRIWKRYETAEFRCVGVVCELSIFPLKGCKGQSIETGTITHHGLSGGPQDMLDRTFMIVDMAKGQRAGAKQIHRLIKVESHNVNKNTIMVTAPGFDSVSVTPDYNMPTKSCKIEDGVEDSNNALLYDCGDEAADWITRYIGRKDASGNLEKFRFFYYNPDRSTRTIEPQTRDAWSSIKSKGNDNINFKTGLVDRAAIMISSKQSLDAVNKGLVSAGSKPVGNNVFRGNITVDALNGAAWDEDTWDQLYIDSQDGFKLQSFMKCDRCVLTTVDPETAKVRRDGQPLKWLKTDGKRMCKGDDLNYYGSPIFGNFFAPMMDNATEKCTIKIGDRLYAHRK